MEQLHALAKAAGILREWTDVEGRQQVPLPLPLPAQAPHERLQVVLLGQHAHRLAIRLLHDQRRRLPCAPMPVGDHTMPMHAMTQACHAVDQRSAR